MTDAWLTTVSPADIVGPVFFLLAWVGYALYADREHRRPTAWVVWVIYRREFRSRLLRTLAPPEEAGQPFARAGGHRPD